jgi:hypothetical protein
MAPRTLETMKARKLGWMLWGLTSLACSGRFEVGEMDATAGVGGNRGAAGGAAPGGAPGTSTAGNAVMVPGGGNNPPSDIAADCLTASAPEPLTGPFVAPEVVWHRVARLTSGKVMPPLDLPEQTTNDWAQLLVDMELASSNRELGTAPGAEAFLRQWLRLEADATFDVAWGALIAGPSPVLPTLLFTTGKPYRTGIFTEPSWLSRYSTISARGAGVELSLFATAVPPEPDGLQTPPPDPSLPDRRALEAQTAEPVCAGCHRLTDPVGYALGHFARDGSYRALDHGEPIDTTGSRYQRSDVDGMIEFDGIADFGQKYANTCEATLGFSDAFLRAALLMDSPPDLPEALFEESQRRVQRAFIAGGRSYSALVRAYIQSPAGLLRP